MQIIKSNFEKFGFQPIETPSFENSDTLMGKYGEEGDQLIFKVLNSRIHESKDDKKELLKKEGNNYDTFFLVTSDFHMLRAKLIAKHFDINVIPVATATNIFTLPINLFREEIAFIKTLIFDLN